MYALLIAAAAMALATGPDPAPGPHDVLNTDGLQYRIQPSVVIEDFDGKGCWFHARGGIIPSDDPNAAPTVLITMQKWYVNVSDYFSGLSFIKSDDMGKTWSDPVTPDTLAWRSEANDTTVGVCDFTPGWHPQTKTLFGMGHTVRYQNGKLMKDPRPRETAYSVYDANTNQWSDWDIIKMPDMPIFFNSGNGCGQWLVEDNGDLLVPIYFKPASTDYYAVLSTTVMRCSFDGKTVRYKEHGNILTTEKPRGAYEPSLTRHKGKFYLTMRNDDRAYVSVSDDGLNYAPITPWLFDDGKEIGSYNTQAHWVSHSDALFLVYTRKDPATNHIPRNRAPLYMSQVDTEKMCLIRSTEQIVVPERGAMLGNFGVVTVSPNETWVTVGEGMYKPEEAMKHGAKGRVWASRIVWSRPNKLRLP
ncbi:MAG: glycoside hydrolase [Candidatus Hydrogenedentes bacterium]|nr:glycoside hydrolase [Candidatus Hydrogenedentota bacterium]